MVMNYGGLLNPNRDWGQNPERNQWVAGLTGYSGDFNNGQFGQWGLQNGWDAQTLVNAYDSMNQSGGGQFMGSQQQGWGSSPALQGLLSGYQTPTFNFSLPSFSTPSFGYPTGSFGGASSQPGFAGVFPPANYGSNWLWTS